MYAHRAIRAMYTGKMYTYRELIDSSDGAALYYYVHNTPVKDARFLAFTAE